jgi:hypothetical protein
VLFQRNRLGLSAGVIRHEKERVHLVDKLVLQPLGSAAMGCSRLLAAMHHGRLPNVF